MSEYYAVVRSGDHLSHYGVKGMKWGVRKALKKNNLDRLSIQYARATNKLNTLKKRTNRKSEKQAAKDKAIAGATGIGVGALGGLASYGVVKGQLASKSPVITYPVGLAGTSALAAGIGVGSIGSSLASAYRATKRGNEKAVKKYKRFKSEMDTAFKGQNRKKLEKHYNRLVAAPYAMPGSSVNSIKYSTASGSSKASASGKRKKTR